MACGANKTLVSPEKRKLEEGGGICKFGVFSLSKPPRNLVKWRREEKAPVERENGIELEGWKIVVTPLRSTQL